MKAGLFGRRLRVWTGLLTELHVSSARSRVLVGLAAIGWLGLIVALAVTLSSSQASARRGIDQRLVTRTASGAEFASLYVNDIFTRERQQARALLAARTTTAQAMGRASSAVGVTAAVLLDHTGRVLQVLPAKPSLIGQDLATKYAHLASAVGGRPAVSNVVPSAARGLPVVGFAEPFATDSGRRVFSGAYAVAKTPLGAYLDHLLVVPGNHVFLVDANDELIASNSPRLIGGSTLTRVDPRLATQISKSATGSYPSARDRQSFVSVPVAGTPWRIIVTVPESELYKSVDGASKWLVWLGLIGLAIAGLVIIALGSHLLRSRARLRALNVTLDRVGRIDSLSGLSNRRDIEERLVTAHSSARRRQTPFTVLLIDIDHFKIVNDTLGHEAGDAVIVEIGDAIRSAVRLEDSVGRWGGEEFLAVLPDTDRDGALITAERIRTQVAELQTARDGIADLTVTVGGAMWTAGEMDDLVDRADHALYAGKAAGRNNVQIAPNSTSSAPSYVADAAVDTGTAPGSVADAALDIGTAPGWT